MRHYRGSIHILPFLFLVILMPNRVSGQDIHFSQFYNSPINLNPGLIGTFDGDYRVVANQRSQWSSVTVPYSTFSLSLDAKDILNSPISSGLSIYTDKAGDSDFSTLQMALGVGYAIELKDSSHRITINAQPAFTQRSINYNQLQFDNQYNGNYFDASLSNGENFANDGATYFNLHAGISWNYKIAQRKELTIGSAVHNIVGPEQSFFSNSVPLHKRFTVHASGLIGLTDKVDVLPSLLFQKQHKFKEIVIGSQGKYHLNNGNYKAIYAGIWYRNSDASYFTIGLDYANFHFGISYDLNLSSLKVASNHRGGFEFALIYILERFKPEIKRYKACPDYI